MFFVKKNSVPSSQLELLFKQLYPRLCDFANYMVNDDDLSEDLVQDAFANYIERKEYISENINIIKSFLYSSIKHACLNKIRHDKVVNQHNKNNPLEIYSEPKILEGIIHSEIIANIHHAISKLPKGCALVIRYSYLEGLNNSEIADLMDISINTVKSQKKRALTLMKIHLGKANLGYLVALMVHSNFLK